MSVKEITDTGIKMAIRVWTKNQEFLEVSSEIVEDSKAALDLEKINF